MDRVLTLPIAQLQFDALCPFNFARAVADLHAILSTSSGEAANTNWGADDVVQMSIGHLRLYLICGETQSPAPASHLTLIVSLSDDSIEGDAVASGRRLKSIADLLVAQMSGRLLPVAVTWDKIEGAVTAELAEFWALQMFHAAMARAATSGALAPGLRNPVSETEVQSFFGRMPQIGMRREKRAAMPALAAPVPQQRKGGSVLRATVLLVWLPFSASVYVNAVIRDPDGSLLPQVHASAVQPLAGAQSSAP